MSITEDSTGVRIPVNKTEVHSLVEFLQYLLGRRDETGKPFLGFDDSIYTEETTRISFGMLGETFAVSDHMCVCYRGQPSADYNLLPSLARVFEKDGRTSFSLLSKEYEIIQTSKYKFPEVFRQDLQPLELLALLQHHGLPTRLLDISDNPLVALYFACQPVTTPKVCKDGEVIIFRRSDSDLITSPIKNAIADSYRFLNTETKIKNVNIEYKGTKSKKSKIQDESGEYIWEKKASDTLITSFYKNVLAQPYFIEHKDMYNEYFKTEEEISEFLKGEVCGSNVIFAYAPVRNYRQLIQQSGYILFSNDITKKYVKSDKSDFDIKYCFTNQISPIDKDNHDGRNVVCARIRIPEGCKSRIIEDLGRCGISREILFLDSEDIVCHETAESVKNKIFSEYISDVSRGRYYRSKKQDKN